jgi:hypothetical protein
MSEYVLDQLLRLQDEKAGANDENNYRVNVLTRAQARQQKQKKKDPEFLPNIPVANLPAHNWSRDELRKLQQSDETLSVLRHHVISGSKPSESELRRDKHLAHYFFQIDAICIEDGLLFRRYFDNTGSTARLQLLIPKSMQNEILTRCHVFELGHTRSFLKNSRFFQTIGYFVHWQTKLKLVLKSCLECLKSVSRKEPRNAKITARRHFYKVGECLCIDMIEGIRQDEKCTNVLTIQDSFSKYTRFIAIPDKSGQVIANQLLLYFLQYGVPSSIICDNSLSFTAGAVKNLCDLFGVKINKTLFYLSRANPAERVQKFFHSLMTKNLGPTNCWTKLLPYVESVLNASVHGATDFAPSHIFFGRQIFCGTSRLLYDIPEVTTTYGEEIAQILENAETVHQMVYESLQQSATDLENRYNKFKKSVQFQVGERALLFSPKYPRHKFAKWCQYWRETVEVLKKLTDSLYLIQVLGGRRRSFVVNIEKLQKLPTHLAFPHQQRGTDTADTAAAANAAASLGAAAVGAASSRSGTAVVTDTAAALARTANDAPTTP